MNTPYVKQYNELGQVANPIEKNYMSMDPNRKQRRQPLQKDRFHGESKNFHLTVTLMGRYRRVRQVIGSKTILHYVLC